MRHRLRNVAQLVVVAVVLLALFSSPGSARAVAACSSDGYTIITMNGIFTNEDDAVKNKNSLQDLLPKKYKNEKLNIDFVWNQTHLAGLGDILKAIEQKLFDSETVDDYDLREMWRDAAEKVTTQKLLLVAHSQGNFYANSFYDVVTRPTQTTTAEVAPPPGGTTSRALTAVPKESIGVYGVANPSGRVAGGGQWLTSDTDKVIAGIVAKTPGRSIMTPNTHIELLPDDDQLGHSFTTVYLRHRGAEIVSGIQSSLDKLQAYNAQDSLVPQGSLVRGPCLAPPPLTLAHKIEGVALAVADPVAQGTKVAIVQAFEANFRLALAIAKTIAAVFAVPEKAVASAYSVFTTTRTAEVGLPAKTEVRPLAVAVTNVKTLAEAEAITNRGLASQTTDASPLPATVIVKTADDDAAGRELFAEILAQAAQTAEGYKRLVERLAALQNTEQKTQNPNKTQEQEPKNIPHPNPPLTKERETVVVDLESTSTRAVLLALQSFGGGGAPSQISASAARGAGGGATSDRSPTSARSEVGLLATTTAVATTTPSSPPPEEEEVTATTTTPLVLPVLSVAGCSQSLATDGCLLFGSPQTLAFSWTSAGTGTAYTLKDGSSALGTVATDTLSLSRSLPAGTHAFSLVATRDAESISSIAVSADIASTSPLLISEIMWSGNLDLPNDEWIELKNTTSHTLDMTKFSLSTSPSPSPGHERDATTTLSLTGSVAPNAYFLLEHGDDQTVADVAADMIYNNLPLPDAGALLSLSVGAVEIERTPALLPLPRDLSFPSSTCPNANSAVANATTTGWCAGNNAPDFTSMERVSFSVSGTTASNWLTNDGQIPSHRNGKDRNGQDIYGTPKQPYVPAGPGPVRI